MQEKRHLGLSFYVSHKCSEPEAIRYMSQIIAGMHELHTKRNLILNKFSPHHIFVTQQGRILKLSMSIAAFYNNCVDVIGNVTHFVDTRVRMGSLDLDSFNLVRTPSNNMHELGLVMFFMLTKVCINIVLLIFCNSKTCIPLRNKQFPFWIHSRPCYNI